MLALELILATIFLVHNSLLADLPALEHILPTIRVQELTLVHMQTHMPDQEPILVHTLVLEHILVHTLAPMRAILFKQPRML